MHTSSRFFDWPLGLTTVCLRVWWFTNMMILFIWLFLESLAVSISTPVRALSDYTLLEDCLNC